MTSMTNSLGSAAGKYGTNGVKVGEGRSDSDRYYAPYPATKMDVRSATTVEFVTPNLAAMISLAGAIAADESGLMNV